jgi:hypothetical protein
MMGMRGASRVQVVAEGTLCYQQQSLSIQHFLKQVQKCMPMAHIPDTGYLSSLSLMKSI